MELQRAADVAAKPCHANWTAVHCAWLSLQNTSCHASPALKVLCPVFNLVSRHCMTRCAIDVWRNTKLSAPSWPSNCPTFYNKTLTAETSRRHCHHHHLCTATAGDACLTGLWLQAQAAQGQLVREVKGFVKLAREGIRQRQAALQYARSSWQV